MSKELTIERIREMRAAAKTGNIGYFDVVAPPEAIDFLLAKLDEMRAEVEHLGEALKVAEGVASAALCAALAQHHGTEGEPCKK